MPQQHCSSRTVLHAAVKQEALSGQANKCLLPNWFFPQWLSAGLLHITVNILLVQRNPLALCTAVIVIPGV